MDLQRFLEAQDRGGAFAAALAEIEGGRKRGHWIWFIFPQLAGLGSSAMSVRYAIGHAVEADAYFRHPVLFERLSAITSAVAAQVDGTPIETLMGSSIDAQKLVSSLTLFRVVASRLQASTGDDRYARYADQAARILEAADRQGYPECAHTLRRIGSTSNG